MPKSKKPAEPVQEGQALQEKKAARPKAALGAFSALVSTLGVSMEASKALDAPGARELGAPSEAIEKAWALASSPSALASSFLWMMDESKHIDYPARHLESHESLSRAQRLAMALPGGSDHDYETLVQGIEACAADIERVARSEGFKKGAGAYAKLVAHPMGEQALAYPAIGVALMRSGTMVDGKKVQTLAAYELPARGRLMVKEEGGWHYHQKTVEELALMAPGLEAPGAKALEKELKALQQTLKDKAAAPTPQSDVEASVDNFAVALHAGKTPWIKGDQRLPSVKAVREVFDKKAERHENHYVTKELEATDGSRGEHVESRARALKLHFGAHWWKGGLSAALAPETGIGGARERSAKLALDAGAWAQARLGPWDKNGETAPQNWIDTNKFMEELARLVPQNQNGYRDYRANRWALAAWGKGLAEGGESAQNNVKMLERAWRKQVGFGRLGEGLAGVSALLAGEDARLGMIQWARQLTLRSTESESHYRRDEKPEELAGKFKRLDEALEALKRATAKAARAFQVEALAEAERVESAWMEKAGFLSAWKQAASLGEINAKSVGWALANPATGALSSSDPRERMAGLSARMLGLRVGEDGAALAQAMDKALIERGASEQGVELLGRPEAQALRDALAKLCALGTGSDAASRRGARDALPFFCEALAACAKLGMPGDMAGAFAQAYVGDVEHFSRQGLDGLKKTMSPMRVKDVASAKLARELGEAKKNKHASFVQALALDWSQAWEKAGELGMGAKEAHETALARSKELAGALSERPLLDWRKVDFEAEPAWEVFGMPSPRFTAALSDASVRGGVVGKWCAQAARRLGVSDAADGNDLIAKTREVVKSRMGIGDGAWKMAIKSEQALESLASALGFEFHAQGEPKTRQVYQSFSEINKTSAKPAPRWALSEAETPSQGERQEPTHWSGGDSEQTMGAALMAAVSKNINPQTAIDTARILTGFKGGRQHHDCFPLIFGKGLPAVQVETADDALFYERELAAKESRQAKIFQEAAKRLEKLREDAKKPPKAGEVATPPETALREELIDLRDWIAGSEAGLWQEMPAEPTWGQMRRMSQQWHAEQAAEQADKAARQEVSRQAKAAREAARDEEELARQGVAQAARNREHQARRQEEERREREAEKRREREENKGVSSAAQAFAPTAKAAWKALIGKFERDGWEAVELCTAAALTEEGTAMRHCVSTYASSCREGLNRIFSVRLNGERVCTLQIGSGGRALHKLPGDAEFAIQQNKGRSNAAVNAAETVAFCQETLEAVQRKWNELNADWVQEMQRIKRLEEQDELRKQKEAQEQLDRDIEARLAARSKSASAKPQELAAGAVAEEPQRAARKMAAKAG